MTLLGRKDLPANNFKELQAYVKANGNKVTLANAGLGAVSHLCGLLFMSQMGVELTTVPYKGTGPAMNDLLGGQVDLLCDQTTQTVPFIKDGRIKVYGVTTHNRLGSLPNVPTLDEQGLKGFEVKVWHGMYAPKGTPKEVIDKLNAALKTAMADPHVKQRLAELSSDIPSADKMTPEGLRTHLTAHVQAAAVGQAHVEHQHVEGGAFDLLQCVAHQQAVGDLQAGALQRVDDRARNGGVVFQ